MKCKKKLAAARKQRNEKDATWFDANPNRNYCLRKPFADEYCLFHGDITRVSAVLVCRMLDEYPRIFCKLNKPLESFDGSDATAALLYVKALQAAPEQVQQHFCIGPNEHGIEPSEFMLPLPGCVQVSSITK